jgi:hypothetical protein
MTRKPQHGVSTEPLHTTAAKAISAAQPLTSKISPSCTKLSWVTIAALQLLTRRLRAGTKA